MLALLNQLYVRLNILPLSSISQSLKAVNVKALLGLGGDIL